MHPADGPLQEVTVEATPDGVARMTAALAAALDGGPAVLPVPADPAHADVLRRAARVDEPADGIALLVPTSGSTGTPKLVALSAAALRASVAGTAAALGGDGTWLLALPTTHVAGLQVLTRSVLAGTTPVVHGAGHFDAASFAAAAARVEGARRYTALVPTQLRRVLADPAGVAALVSFGAVLVGGAATAPGLLAAARATGAHVVTTYGMSETAGGCLYDGRPVGGARFALDDDGRIRLGGPTLAAGYRGEPGLTAAAFRDGWFVTADVGRVGPDGALEVVGRIDDVVVTGGVNVHPLAVEAVLARAPGVADVCVAGVPDPEWGTAVHAWVVVAGDVGDVDEAGLRAAVRDALGAAAVPRVVHRIGAIPLLPSGKPDRRGLAARAGADAD